MESVMVFIRKVKLSLLTIIAATITVSCICFTGSVAAQATIESTQTIKASVLTGIDVLQRDGFRQLSGQNIGLITNQTGINAAGIRSVRLLHDAHSVTLLAIFSPEHGLLGKLDIPLIENSVDPGTGIKVFSLYGSTRKPNSEMLSGLDTLVFDIQDIGTRFYTYISTMGHAMQAANEHGVRFVVLDRPNPINGITVSGPVLDEGRQSFTAFHRLPVRHGMTIGELARMFKAELQLDLDLEIIPLEGWQRTDYFDSTTLPWVNPSPNMRSLTEAILYPGIGLLETTNLSVGRGTDTPFELFGAPWLDGNQLALELNRLDLPGVRFTPVQFTPDVSKYEGESCGGVGIEITERGQFESVRSGLEVAIQLRRLYPLKWEIERYDRLLGNKAVLEAIRLDQSYPQIHEVYSSDLQHFIDRRSQFLIYR
ncbi:MAG: DUF1343 domain-containing protein [Lysobacterales bacterium]